MTQLGPTPIRPVIQYEPKGVEVPEGWRLVGWVNQEYLDERLGTRDFISLWPNECFHAQVPVLVPVEDTFDPIAEKRDDMRFEGERYPEGDL